MKPFCNVPFVGLSARHDGTAKICCNINKSEGITKTGTYDNPGSEKFNLNLDNFQDIWNSEYMKDFRNKMLTGGFDKACSRCITHNNQGVFTMRKKYNSHFDPSEIEKRVEQHQAGHSVSLPQWYDFRFSIACDSSCTMCGPGSSNFLFKDWRKHSKFLDKDKIDQIDKAKSHYKLSIANSDFIKQVKNNLDKINFFEFRGGEPLVDRDVMDFITDVSHTQYAKNIRIDIVTNGQQFPKHFIPILNKFKKGYLRYSIDGFDRVNEYIRYPAKWSKCENTLNLLSDLHENWDIKIISTLQVYNILNIGKLLEYLDDKYQYKVISNSVWGVDHLSPYVMPLEKRIKYAKTLEDRFPNFAKIIKKDVEVKDPQILEKLRNHNKLMEASRGKKVTDAIPEMQFLYE